ncbi:hypothetical protein [Shewanella sp. MBTL60-007]|uniref:hypothetical protein n=1 Tax=Shewanella sp. MBTL60-007 TaxID=2815911 RepID=UPI001C7EDE89|nr:hypothetical protein [Shewanella sp. MBTL60-007]
MVISYSSTTEIFAANKVLILVARVCVIYIEPVGRSWNIDHSVARPWIVSSKRIL